MDFSCSEKNGSRSVPENDKVIQPKTDRSKESDGKTLQKDWSRLDSAILEQIYSFLSRRDQFSMSLVCKNWLREYESPYLWRSFKFPLPEYICSCDTCPEVKFPKKFAKFFRHVQIICQRVRRSLINDIYIQLSLFLDFITNDSQLLSLRFIGMSKYYMQMDDDDYTSLLQSTMELLLKQKNLELLEFRESMFLREDGAKLLKIACENSTRTLKTIIIKGFVTDSIEIETEGVEDYALYRSLKKHIMSLTSIQTDYTQFLENIIMTRLDEPPRTWKLSLLEIECDGSKKLNFQGILPEAWQDLNILCPDLKVHMIITSFHPRNDYCFYIVQHMRLEHLEYRISTPLGSNAVKIGNFFQHLVHCGCTTHLENLTVVWMPSVGNLAIPLIPFLEAAQKLRRLNIYISCPVYGIEDIFLAWLRRRPHRLECAHIFIVQGRRQEDFQNLANLVYEYSPLVKDLGLHVCLVEQPPQYF